VLGKNLIDENVTQTAIFIKSCHKLHHSLTTAIRIDALAKRA